MASAAFRSTARRPAVGAAAEDTSSTNRGGGVFRRSRSLSRGPQRFPPPDPEPEEEPTPRSRFVNKSRGSGFPEISDEFFRAKYEPERTPLADRLSRRASEVSPRLAGAVAAEQLQRRGRSVSRRSSRDGNGFQENGSESSGVSERSSGSKAAAAAGNLANKLGVSGNGSSRRRQRSLSVARYRCRDPESYSSALTDDEGMDARKNGIEKIIRTVYSQKMTEHPIGDDGDPTGIYEVMRKKVRHVVEEIRTELEKVLVNERPSSVLKDGNGRIADANILQAFSEVHKKYATEMEESEKRKQDLLAELAVEEQRGLELTKIVMELLPSPAKSNAPSRPHRSRRKSNDKARMTRCLNEEAEKYIEDFLMNVEDTDISSYDGERSDASSNPRGDAKLRGLMENGGDKTESHENTSHVASICSDTDGVALPWLQWETHDDSSPPIRTKTHVAMVSASISSASEQVIADECVNNSHFASSRGSWSPGCKEASSIASESGGRFGEAAYRQTRLRCSNGGSMKSSFDMDEYRRRQPEEDILLERLKQRGRLESGGLLLCWRNNF